MFKMGFKLATDLKRWADKKKKEHQKAMSLALSKGSFQLMKQAKQDLKSGRLKLQRLSYVTDQSDPRFKKQRRGRGARSRAKLARAPLTGLFKGITYKVDRQRLKSEVGFRGRGGFRWTQKYAQKSYEGYQWRYTEEQRAALHKIGIHLRPSTAFGRVPPRDIMGVVQDRYERKTAANIRVLFLRRIAGERI
jgi:hypothetical protein